MSLELWNTVATFGRFVVITGTAIAATVQLRFLRRNNQIAYLNELRKTVTSEEFRAAVRFIDTVKPMQFMRHPDRLRTVLRNN